MDYHCNVFCMLYVLLENSFSHIFMQCTRSKLLCNVSIICRLLYISMHVCKIDASKVDLCEMDLCIKKYKVWKAIKYEEFEELKSIYQS